MGRVKVSVLMSYSGCSVVPGAQGRSARDRSRRPTILMSMDQKLPRTGPGRDPDVRKALADIDRLVRENPPRVDFDLTAAIRMMRDTD